jgi:hypothetical protein
MRMAPVTPLVLLADIGDHGIGSVFLRFQRRRKCVFRLDRDRGRLAGDF